MKSFKCGLSIFLESIFILITLVTAGMFFYRTAIESGYMSVLFFFAGLFSFAVAVTCIYCIGATYQTKERNEDK